MQDDPIETNRVIRVKQVETGEAQGRRLDGLVLFGQDASHLICASVVPVIDRSFTRIP